MQCSLRDTQFTVTDILMIGYYEYFVASVQLRVNVAQDRLAEVGPRQRNSTESNWLDPTLVRKRHFVDEKKNALNACHHSRHPIWPQTKHRLRWLFDQDKQIKLKNVTFWAAGIDCRYRFKNESTRFVQLVARVFVCITTEKPLT